MNPTIGSVYALRYPRSHTSRLSVVMVYAKFNDCIWITVVHDDGAVTFEEYPSNHFSTWLTNEFWREIR
jgi:hypothetical protein